MHIELSPMIVWIAGLSPEIFERVVAFSSVKLGSITNVTQSAI